MRGIGKDTNISWADSTFNLSWGCRKVDDACRRCYLFRIAKRINDKVIPLRFFDIDKKITELRSWPRSRRFVFVNSMSDTYHEDISDDRLIEWHIKIFNAEEFSGRIFILLTKRIGRAMIFYRKHPEMLTDNVWVGCSIGEKKRLWRLDQLRQIPAKTLFVSFEPLIEDLGDFNLKGIQWAIVGGESDYHNPRPMKAEWAESIRQICLRDQVVFWFKQMGGKGGGGAGGDLLNGVKYQEYPIRTEPVNKGMEQWLPAIKNEKL